VTSDPSESFTPLFKNVEYIVRDESAKNFKMLMTIIKNK